ncbi:hypothetical protein AB0B45_31470 [Nonomuraea sp. NPDC049152]|uniref:hypothetical protein n=1 Tax=Nonomuraea sp. NPDC049152 TaxID=3154350 RepID=UPI0033C9E520
MRRWKPEPKHLIPLLAFLACLVCDLVAPLTLVRDDGGFFPLLTLFAGMVSLLAAPLLLLLSLGRLTRWTVAAAVMQLVLGFVTFAGGAQPLHALYLSMLGRPVEATVADTTDRCGNQPTGQDAATGPYVCTVFLDLVQPDGDPVAGGAMIGSEFTSARWEAVRKDGNLSDSITVLEDPLGLVRPLPADPGTGRPMMSDPKSIHGVILVICWIAFAGSLVAVFATSRRPRVTSAGEDDADSNR